MKETQNLGTIEWRIYDFIKSNSEQAKWVKQADIQEYLIANGYVPSINIRTVRKMVHKIKEFDGINKIIVTDHKNGYKMLSEEDNYELLSKRKIQILKMLKLYYKDVKRYNLNNQQRITFTDYEKDIIESLVKEV